MEQNVGAPLILPKDIQDTEMHESHHADMFIDAVNVANSVVNSGGHYDSESECIIEIAQAIDYINRVRIAQRGHNARLDPYWFGYKNPILVCINGQTVVMR